MLKHSIKKKLKIILQNLNDTFEKLTKILLFYVRFFSTSINVLANLL